ncbi:MAG TPA: hypothetical protein VFV13_01770, partial [Acidimicrobiia bacterium]|nr:hypothetical protein [Acidimicrobiia bacterium]
MALALGAWAVWFIDRPQGGLVLIRLSLLPAVVGGGFGPPLIGIIAGVVGYLSLVPGMVSGHWIGSESPLYLRGPHTSRPWIGPAIRVCRQDRGQT